MLLRLLLLWLLLLLLLLLEAAVRRRRSKSLGLFLVRQCQVLPNLGRRKVGALAQIGAVERAIRSVRGHAKTVST